MRFPPQFQKTATVYHLPTTAGAKQPYPGSASLTVTGAFLPMDRHAHALEGAELLNPHEFYVDAGTDIRVGDKVVIDSVTYFVKFIFDGYAGGLAHKRCSLSTQ